MVFEKAALHEKAGRTHVADYDDVGMSHDDDDEVEQHISYCSLFCSGTVRTKITASYSAFT